MRVIKWHSRLNIASEDASSSLQYKVCMALKQKTRLCQFIWSRVIQLGNRSRKNLASYDKSWIDLHNNTLSNVHCSLFYWSNDILIEWFISVPLQVNNSSWACHKCNVSKHVQMDTSFPSKILYILIIYPLRD